MKRVVAFLDMFDEIPDNGTYLFSKQVEILTGEKEEQGESEVKTGEELKEPKKMLVYFHYYELDHMDFEELMSSESSKKTPAQKIKEFKKNYKA